MSIIDKKMPPKFDYSDHSISFVLARKAFFNKTYDSYLSHNLPQNNSSINNPKPLYDKSSDLRTQRLRMTAIGSGNSKLKNLNDEVRFKAVNQNYVNTALTKVKGYGSSSVPKKNSITR